MGVCVNFSDFARRHGICAAAAVVAAVSAAFAFFALSLLRAEYGAYNAASRESSALRLAAESRESALARAKSFLSHAEPLPPRADTANRFYASLLEAISASGMEGVKVSASESRDGENVFVVSGRAEYTLVRELLFSLRKFPFLTRLSKLSMSGASGREVEFSAEIAAFVADVEGVKK